MHSQEGFKADTCLPRSGQVYEFLKSLLAQPRVRIQNGRELAILGKGYGKGSFKAGVLESRMPVSETRLATRKKGADLFLTF